MRNPNFIIKTAAESVTQLRRIDVERVLDNCTSEELQPTAAWITEQRPDLAAKVEKELNYQTEERQVIA